MPEAEPGTVPAAVLGALLSWSNLMERGKVRAKRTGTTRFLAEGDAPAVGMEALSKHECKWCSYVFQAGT